jgi:hypothetical protein
MSPIVVTNSSPSGLVRRVPAGTGGGSGVIYSTGFDSMTTGSPPTPRSYEAGPTEWNWNAYHNRLVSEAQSVSPAKSLSFVYPAQPVPDEVVREGGFYVGQDIGEHWFAFQWYVPSNYVHRNVGGAGPTGKLFQVWRINYGNSMTWGVSFNRVSDTQSSFYPTATRGNAYGVTQASVQTYPGFTKDQFIGTGCACVPGQWNSLRFHFKPASSRSATDGIWKMWVNGSVYMDGGGTLWPPLAEVGQTEDTTIERGYLMGSHNAGYLDETTFYIDDVLMTTTNPGW